MTTRFGSSRQLHLFLNKFVLWRRAQPLLAPGCVVFRCLGGDVICRPPEPSRLGVTGAKITTARTHFSNRGQMQAQSGILRVKFSVDTLP